MTLPSLSVQIVQWGQTAFTMRCVDAVFRGGYSGNLEVLVYDNASPDGPGPVADDQRVALNEGRTNIGFGPAHNKLAESAGGDLLLILNNDTIVAPGALDALATRKQETNWGAVTPQYRDFDGRTLEMGGYLGPAGEGWQMFRKQRPPSSLRRLPYQADYGSGACLLVSRSDFLRLGGFDDIFAPAYYEDTDLCMKLASESGPTIVEPSAVVYHFEGATSGRDTSAGPKAYQIRNRSRFLERWKDQLSDHQPMSARAAMTRLARPDSEDGLRILWLGPHLPRVDREAGHVRMVKMMEILRTAGNFVGYWSEQCFHCEEYGAVLEGMGVPWFGQERAYRPGLPDSVAELGSAQAVVKAVEWDVAIISFPELASRLIDQIRRLAPGLPILVDDVDLHFIRAERAEEMGIKAPAVIDRQIELATYSRADGVITASAEESDVLSRELPGLPTWPFAVAAEPPTVGDDGLVESLLFLGNFDHHPNVDAVDWWVEHIAGAVERHAGRQIALRVVGAGSERFESMSQGGHLAVDLGGWVPDLTSEFHRARVFLAPLRYGAGTKGKILNAMSHGVPVVTTSVGAEGNDASILASMSVADDAESLGSLVAELMTNDQAWRVARKEAIEAGRMVWERQEAVSAEFVDWVRRRASG